ncbi:MAG: Holliday junction resolvase RuvX [Planctomycetota bacterium]|nr:MAG: Holliday junction resolvase RuvX [Planctomycetota bacterium]
MHERILSIDYGRVRHGLAVSDGLGLMAHPLPCLKRTDAARDEAHLRRLIDERDVLHLLLGLPLNMDGSEGPMAQEVRRFGATLSARLKLPLHYEDERLSTDEAETRLQAQGLRPRERRKLRDSLAAAVILDGVLGRGGLPPQVEPAPQ